ncbi:MarR family transcriptional regulator [Acutalibacter sp. 1XD8-33]|uniref:MarR family winged helix-turn-helix transcriptional regulator n=1 Tax=Acutalibacter sp. 1XD8-33 TaxID=2320081 RepID=UPI000EA01EF5|nr:MarR family transcriptional regulator [Acutalibacter sp. 1XD8-33]RKJ40772.1 MarR family transcriptional regulator [Acutalibacter sp. 1XD8-33]
MKNPPVDPWLLEYNALIHDNDSLYRAAARRLGVSDCTLWILYSLRAESQPLTQKRLCGLMYLPKQTVNSALKAMEAEGTITLSAGDDRRTRVISLTETGEELARRTADRVVLAEEQALAGMGREERERFLRDYRKFTDLLRQAMSQWDQS